MQSVSISGDSWFAQGNSITLTANITMKNSSAPKPTSCTWTSSSTATATISGSGTTATLTGVYRGWTYITATCGDVASSEKEIAVANYRFYSGAAGYWLTPVDSPTSYSSDNKMYNSSGGWSYGISYCNYKCGCSYYFVNIGPKGNGCGYQQYTSSHSCQYSVHKNWYVYVDNNYVYGYGALKR